MPFHMPKARRDRRARAVLAVLGTLAGGMIHAQPDDERIVVVGSRLAGDGFGPGNVSVRDRQDIERAAPGDAEQLLRRLPGVSLFRPGGAGGVSELFVRGGESNFTAVYIDGVRLNDTTNTRGGSFDFSTLPAFRVQRVELAPGAMSAIYGADAMAGVIRIETAWPAPGDISIQAEIGSESDWRAAAGSAFALGNGVELGLIGSVSDAGDEIEGSTLETAELGARLRLSRGDEAGWTLVARFVERDRMSFPEVSGGPIHAVLRELESSESRQASLSAGTSWRFTDDWTAELTLSRAETKDDFQSPPIAPGILDGQPAFSTTTDFSRTEVLFVNRYRISPALHAAFGVDLVAEDGRDDGSIDLGGLLLPAAYELDRDIRSAFVEIGRNFAAGVDTSIAIRADRTGARDEVSGKLNLSKEFTAIDGRIWVNAANGFKLPSFFALGNPLYGNPDLAPEQVESLEIGYAHQATERIGYGVSLFENRYEDLIDFDFETFTSVNRASVDVEGIQSSLTYAVSDSLTVSLDATFLSVETGEGSTLPRRPEKLAGITVERTLGQGWSVTGSVRHVGSRTISSIPTGIIEDGSYQLADLALRKDTDNGLAYWIAFDNLFDAEYMHAPGFPAPGARIRLGAEFVY
jgi:vitamin B12 transporter